MRPICRLLAVFLLVSLGACATTQPASFDARLATAYQTVTAVRTTTAELIAAGKITGTKAQGIQQIADKARAALDAAAITKDSSSLDLAINVLKALEGQL